MTARGARLYALVARNARQAVVFRRGPSRRVLLLRWDLQHDIVTPGQWFAGRLYERRCDLSPNGDLLGYFAATYRGPFQTWTAVSRPPYLTALALWPKGDAWGGGALFQDDRTLLLNHRPDEMQPAEGFTTPAGFAVRPLGERSGLGEDDPIMTTRLERDGWVTTSPGERSAYRHSGPMRWRFDPPRVLEKPLGRRGLRLRVNVHGLGEQGGPWYVQTGEVIGPAGVVEAFGRIDWADIDHNGDVLLAREGRLFRHRQRTFRAGVLPDPALLVADLNDLRFSRRAAPDQARSWPKLNRRKDQLSA